MDLKGVYEKIKNNELPTVELLHEILNTISRIIVEEDNLLRINSPINIVGDLHGQYFDFLKMVDLCGKPSILNKYLFLGDYVDRGFNSVELFLSVIILKILNQNEVFLLRGNHESKSMTTNYTFRDECRQKYDENIYLRFCEIFTFLPVCAIVDDKIFCIHGGITPNFSIAETNNIDRFEELPGFYDVYWSDPDEGVDKFEHSSRGAGFLFGKIATDKFLNENNFSCIVRSHQLVESGFDSKFEGKVLTVWSAPNYVYTYGNAASVLYVEKGKLIPKYFNQAEKQFLNNH